MGDRLPAALARALLALVATASVLAPGAPPRGTARAAEPARPSPAELGGRPIHITADRLSADGARDTVVFEGNVVARQEDVTMHAERVTAEYSRASRSVERILAEGRVRILHADREGRGERAVFYNLEQRIVLSGGAELTYGENALKGDTVTIYLRENRSVVTGGEGGRVRAVIHPRSIPDRKETTER